MTTTTFAEFEDGDETFVVGDPVKIIAGDYKGQGGTIDSVVGDGGYYVVKTVAGSFRLVDGLEIEPQNVPKVDYASAPDFGLSSAELATEVADAITRATSRIVGVGNEQYSKDGFQKFETMPLTDLMEGTLEELDDIINYSVMLQIRFRRILKSVTKAID